MAHKYTGSAYEGEKQDGRMHGQGKFTFPDGAIYEGGFERGMFHGDGTVTFPNGSKYIGKWELGKELSGRYEFHDGLRYKGSSLEPPKPWKYCTSVDRRFYHETQQGIPAAGEQSAVQEIPIGTYDVQDGYFDPKSGSVFSFDGETKLREPDEAEQRTILEKCRYRAK